MNEAAAMNEQEIMNLEDDVFYKQPQPLNDPFLSFLCYEDDEENEDDVLSIEDWSGSEQDYESNSDEGSEHDDTYPCYDPTINWKLMKPMVGMKFESLAQLKESLIDYGVANGHPLVFPVNDHNRLLVRCGKEEIEKDGAGTKKVWKCPFRLWATRLTDEDSFQIRTLDDNHTCSRTFCLGSLVEAYKHSIKPLRGSMYWPKHDYIKPLPPKERRMPGRPTVKRKKDPSEKVVKSSKVRFRRKMTCQNCQGIGHNIKTCKNEKKYPAPKQVRPKGRRKKVTRTSVTHDENVG